MALRRPRHPWIRPHRDLGDDDVGSFIVLEAILVALLVLTAILFFTSVQRPSTGSDQGGIDLGRVAADTLSILETRSFTVSGQTRGMADWVANGTRDDATGTSYATQVEEFLEEVLPTGARYAVRLDNGVSNITLFPRASTDVPHAARAAQVMLLPGWSPSRNYTTTVSVPLYTVTPGEIIATTAGARYDLVKPVATGTQYKCYISPLGNGTAYATLIDGDPSVYAWATPDADTWASHWRATPGDDVTWKAVVASGQQVPRDLPYGRWRVYTDTACTTGLTLVDVVPPGAKTVSATLSGTTLTIDPTSGVLTSNDVGKTVTASGVSTLSRARIATVGSTGLTATLSSSGTIASATTVTVAQDPTFLPYAVQLVVWFGA
jgi:hypothetical protein